LQDVFNTIKTSISFMSRLPFGGNADLKDIPAFFPLTGYLAGGFYFFTMRFHRDFPYTLLIIAIGYFLFDLFHLDGLLDLLDGFFYQGDKEKRLKIMKKGDIGAFAAFYLLIYFSALVFFFTHSKPETFLIIAVFGRFSINIILLFGKAVKGSSLCAALFPYKKINTVIAFTLTLPLLLISVKLFAIGLTVTIITASALLFISKKLINGINGDVLGANCLLTQLFILSAIYYLR